MRIIVEATDEQKDIAARVIVEHPHDDLTIDETVQLMSQALCAFGFHNESVRKFFGTIGEHLDERSISEDA